MSHNLFQFSFVTENNVSIVAKVLILFLLVSLFAYLYRTFVELHNRKVKLWSIMMFANVMATIDKLLELVDCNKWLGEDDIFVVYDTFAGL